MNLLFVLTLFVLVLLATRRPPEKYTDEKMNKLIGQETEIFKEFMGLDANFKTKKGKTFDFKIPTKANITKQRKRDIPGTGKKVNLRAAIILAMLKDNLKPNAKNCQAAEGSLKVDCKREIRDSFRQIVVDFTTFRLSKLDDKKEKKNFQKDLHAVILHFNKDTE